MSQFEEIVIRFQNLSLQYRAIIIYLITAILGTAIKESNLLSKLTPFFQGNIVNYIFANNGYIFVSIAFINNTILFYLYHDENTTILPLNTSTPTGTTTSKSRLLLTRFIKYIILFIDLNMVLGYHKYGIFHYISIETGHCSVEGHNSIKQCAKLPNAYWIEGFDPSGHYFLLLTLSLILIDDYMKLSNSTSSTTTPYAKYSIRFNVLLLAIWYYLFMITSIFFHTIFEKFIGFVTGVGITWCINRYIF